MTWKWFTSRYTAHLEQQLEELKAQVKEQRAEIIKLNLALIPALREIVAPGPVTEQVKKMKEEARPALGNFLRSRAALEEGSKAFTIEENPEPRSRTKEHHA